MKTNAKDPAEKPVSILTDEHGGYRENETYFWGGDWTARFAACFANPIPERTNPAVDEIVAAVNEAIAALAADERDIIVDYYIHCHPRRMIAARMGLSEREVDAARARAERRLKSMLAEFVEQRFGLSAPGMPPCPLCRSARREQIDAELDDHRPEQSWSALRRRINQRFGLDIKRVQVVITHWRYHRITHRAKTKLVDNPEV